MVEFGFLPAYYHTKHIPTIMAIYWILLVRAWSVDIKLDPLYFNPASLTIRIINKGDQSKEGQRNIKLLYSTHRKCGDPSHISHILSYNIGGRHDVVFL